MAPNVTAQPFNPLRMVTQRLISTPSTQLPHIAPTLAIAITGSRQAFAEPNIDGKAKGTSDVHLSVHKLKTQLSALLQGKSSHTRFSALILMKAIIEAGEWNMLQGVGPWVKGMIAIIGRPEPQATKKLCIVTLTRIFILTREHQSLVREITTPALATFITASLNAARTTAQPPYKGAFPDPNGMILTVLQAFSKLIVLHPTSFRPFVQQIQTLIFPLIAPTPSNMDIGDQSVALSGLVLESARRLYVLLPVCAPKNTTGEEWVTALQKVILSAQETADRVFRGFLEDWRPDLNKIDGSNLATGKVVSDEKPKSLALPGWKGIYAGVERLEGLLRTAQVFLSSETSTDVVLPVKSLTSLTNRVLSALQASGSRSRMKPEIDRDEREGLQFALPQLHVSAMMILSCMIARMGCGFAPLTQATAEEVSRVLDSEYTDAKVREAAYRVISQVIETFGFALPTVCAKPISRCIELCCEDLLPSDRASAQIHENPPTKGAKPLEKKSSSLNADSYLKPAAFTNTLTASVQVTAAAEALIRLTLTNVLSGFLSMATRTRIDRTAILINNERIMLASVMNPPAQTNGARSAVSILPMLARAHTGDLSFEALLRPQMPIIQKQNEVAGGMPYNQKEDIQLHEREFNGIHEGTGGLSSLHGNADHGAFSEAKIDSQDLMNKALGNDQSEEAFGEDTDDHDVPTEAVSAPKLDPQHLTNKRDREPSDSLGVEYRESRNTVIVDGTQRKRARLTGNEAEQDRKHEISSHGTGLSMDLPPIAASRQTPSLAETAGVGLETGSADSDGSDFEIPALHLDTDTDEEDDSEDDE